MSSGTGVQGALAHAKRLNRRNRDCIKHIESVLSKVEVRIKLIDRIIGQTGGACDVTHLLEEDEE